MLPLVTRLLKKSQRNGLKATTLARQQCLKHKVWAPITTFPKDLTEYRRDMTESNDSKKFFNYFVIATSGIGAVTLGKAGLTDLLKTMSASRAVQASANVEYDLKDIKMGATITVDWRGKPLFIRRRTPKEIDTAQSQDIKELRDPQDDSARVKNPEWLILLGICTHLGCVPAANLGDYKGWYCPCHGSHYDVSGRIRKGPAPRNLEVPPYKFLEEELVLVGVAE